MPPFCSLTESCCLSRPKDMCIRPGLLFVAISPSLRQSVSFRLFLPVHPSVPSVSPSLSVSLRLFLPVYPSFPSVSPSLSVSIRPSTHPSLPCSKSALCSQASDRSCPHVPFCQMRRQPCLFESSAKVSPSGASRSGRKLG